MHAFDRQTDGRTDRQTDRRATEIARSNRVIRCPLKVKMKTRKGGNCKILQIEGFHYTRSIMHQSTDSSLPQPTLD